MKGTLKPALATAVVWAMLAATTMASERPVLAGHSFDAYVKLPVEVSVPAAVAVGDVTGDMRDDVVLVTSANYVNFGSPDHLKVMIYRQAPDGTLLAPLRFPHEPHPENRVSFGVALGHLNGDGILDIAVGDSGGFTVLLTTPTGFESKWIATDVDAETVGILDVNMDGHEDVYGHAWASTGALLLGDGNGNFVPSVITTSGMGYNDMNVDDVNGDGTRDLVITSRQGTPDVNVHPVAPGGGWLPKITFTPPYGGMGPSGAAIGDFNGDGITDIASSDGGASHLDDKPYIHMMAGQGGGQFAAPITFPTANEPQAMAAADFDGNGGTDLAVFHVHGYTRLGIYFQGQTGLEPETSLTAITSSTTPSPAHSIGIGDVDSNGCLDLVLIDDPGMYVYRGRGCGRGTHDFDLDRRSDILWRNPSTGANVVWKAGKSANRFDVMDVGNTAWEIVGQGDFDGDAKWDLVWRNSVSGANTIWRAGGNTAQIALVGVYNLAWKVVGVGDFGGDGKADLVWRNTQNGQNVIWHSANAATQTVLATVPSLSWEVVGVGDFDGDRKSDLLWRNAASGANQVWRSGNSATQLAMAGVYNMAWKVQGVGDFDGDGKSDVFWRNTANGANTIWRSASASQQLPVMGVTSQHWRVVAVADYDADGKSDLLWRNTGNGSNTIWRSGSATTQLPVTGVTNLQWGVVP